MRFPLSLTCATARYLASKKLSRAKRFPMVLMLEPLHACNFHCSGCGRIREYRSTLSETMSVEECAAAADECGAPIVSICGGEPLLYRELSELIDRLLRDGRHLYLCTNGFLLEETLPKILAIKNRRLKKRLYLNVHLDGPAALHDATVERKGAFDAALRGIEAAKKAGLFVYTNTTVYRPTTVDALIEMAETLTNVKIDGMMISPGYGYKTVLDEHASGMNGSDALSSAEDPLFMDCEAIHIFFRELRDRMKQFRLTATPVFLDFLCGDLNLPCAAWANPTRNVRGWRSPCYLIADEHFATYRELIERTDWSKIGPNRDERCRDCMTHCGFEPASVFAVRSIRQIARLAVWQLFQK